MEPAETVVHVWSVPLRGATADSGFPSDVLSPDELDRAARFRFERDRSRYRTARAALRRILGRYAGTEPARVRFRYGDQGKPALSDAAYAIEFNVSHSGDLAVVAVARNAVVGVDLEAVRPVPDALEIARRSLDPADVEALRRCDGAARDRRFLELWTRREAVLKAIGCGLAGIGRIRLTAEADAAEAVLEDADGRAWTVQPIELPAGFVGSLATSTPRVRVEHFAADRAFDGRTVPTGADAPV